MAVGAGVGKGLRSGLGVVEMITEGSWCIVQQMLPLPGGLVLPLPLTWTLTPALTQVPTRMMSCPVPHEVLSSNPYSSPNPGADKDDVVVIERSETPRSREEPPSIE